MIAGCAIVAGQHGSLTIANWIVRHLGVETIRDPETAGRGPLYPPTGASGYAVGSYQPDEWKKRREQFESQANGLAGHFEQPRESFQVAVDEALLFNNSTRMESELLRDSSDRLMGYLKTQPDPAATITAAYWAISSRAPTTDESAAVLDYVSKRSANSADAWKQAIWALMTGPELRFNY